MVLSVWLVAVRFLLVFIVSTDVNVWMVCRAGIPVGTSLWVRVKKVVPHKTRPGLMLFWAAPVKPKKAKK